MRAPFYAVNVYDCAGQYRETRCAGFPEALAVHREERAKFPGKVVLAFNLDRCDVNTDGLTEEEREALE